MSGHPWDRLTTLRHKDLGCLRRTMKRFHAPFAAIGRPLLLFLNQQGPTVRRAIAGRIPGRWQSVLSEDDVMQQTYADAFQSISRFTPLGDGAFRAWLSSLAECNLRDALRMLGANKRGGNRRRVEAFRSEGSYVELYNLLSSSATSPSRQVSRKESYREMEQAIEDHSRDVPPSGSVV